MDGLLTQNTWIPITSNGGDQQNLFLTNLKEELEDIRQISTF